MHATSVRLRTLIFAFCLWQFLLFSFCQITEAMGEGDYSLSRSQVVSKIDSIRDRLFDTPKDIDLYIHKASLQMAIGNSAEAVEDLSEALKLEPRSAALLRSRGVLYLWMGRAKEAARDFACSIELGVQEDPELHALLGEALLLDSQHDEALAEFNRAVDIGGRNARFLALRADAYLQLDRKMDALQDLDSAILEEKGSPWPLVVRANVNSALGNSVDAKEDLNRAIALAPELSALYLIRGDRALSLGQDGAGIADFAKAIVKSHGSTAAYLARARANIRLGRHATALADYAAASETTPRSAGRVHAERGDLNCRLRNYRSAQADYDIALEMEPRNDHYLAKRGEIFARRGRWRSAMADFDAALEQAPTDPNLLCWETALNLEMNQVQRASSFLADLYSSNTREGERCLDALISERDSSIVNSIKIRALQLAAERASLSDELSWLWVRSLLERKDTHNLVSYCSTALKKVGTPYGVRILTAIYDTLVSEPSAFALFFVLLERPPSVPRTYEIAARACARNKKWEEALCVANSGLKFFPENGVLLSCRAVAFAGLGQEDSALKDLYHAASPSITFQTDRHLFKAWSEFREHSAWIDLLARIASVYSENGLLQWIAGDAHIRTGQRIAAVGYYSKAIELLDEWQVAQVLDGCLKHQILDMQLYDSAVARFPFRGDLRKIRGNARCRVGAKLQAADDYAQAIVSGREPLLHDRTFESMECLGGLGEDGWVEYLTAIINRVGTWPVLLHRATAYETQGRYELAKADLEQAMKLSSSPEVYLAYGDFLLRQGDEPRADSLFQRAARQEEPQRSASPVYSFLQSTSNANAFAVAWRSAKDFTSWSPSRYKKLGLKAQEIGKDDLAVELFTAAILASEQPVAELFSLRGMTYEGLGYREEAKRDFWSARKAGGNDAKIYVDIAQRLKEQGRLEEAIDYYSAAIEANPGETAYYYKRSAVLQLQKEYQLAIEDLKKVVVIAPADAFAYNRLGELYRWTARPGKENLYLALQQYLKAIELDRRNDYAYFNAGWTYYKMGEPFKAIEYYSYGLINGANPLSAFRTIALRDIITGHF